MVVEEIINIGKQEKATEHDTYSIFSSLSYQPSRWSSWLCFIRWCDENNIHIHRLTRQSCGEELMETASRQYSL